MHISTASNKFVRFVSIVIFTAWALIVLLTCIFVFGDQLYGKFTFLDKYILHLIGFDFVFNIFAFALLQFPKCKNCGKKVFEETPNVKKNANYWAFVNGWSAVVVQIVTKNQFVCMHCGKTIILKKSE